MQTNEIKVGDRVRIVTCVDGRRGVAVEPSRRRGGGKTGWYVRMDDSPIEEGSEFFYTRQLEKLSVVELLAEIDE